MQCDNCGAEVIINEYGNFKEGGVWPNAYGFVFCAFDPLAQSVSKETCQEKFERKLWEAAQSRKQAEREAESKAPEVSGDTKKVVGSASTDGESGTVWNL